MNDRMWSGRVLLKYSLIQLPAAALIILILLLLRQWISIPSWIVWCLIGLWIIKDLVLYPLVWRAYGWDPSGESDGMTGLCGITNERIDPSGYITVRGELWRARVMDDSMAIEKGENVVVKGREGLTLFIENDPKDDVKEQQ